MPLKKSTGQMYPWVDATHAQLGGLCSHKCSYCYVDNPRWGRPERYAGAIRLIEKEFNVRYDEKTLMRVCGKYPATIFIENCNDLFADDVPSNFIYQIYAHCYQYPDNTYVFQTKNPERFVQYSPDSNIIKYMIGTTVESNRFYSGIMGFAPTPSQRIKAMVGIKRLGKSVKTFLTIEPVLDFDIDILAIYIGMVKPDFLNLGADSKGHGLPEPTVEKVMALVAKLKESGIDLREKHNLERLKVK